MLAGCVVLQKHQIGKLFPSAVGPRTGLYPLNNIAKFAETGELPPGFEVVWILRRIVGGKKDYCCRQMDDMSEAADTVISLNPVYSCGLSP